MMNGNIKSKQNEDFEHVPTTTPNATNLNDILLSLRKQNEQLVLDLQKKNKFINELELELNQEEVSYESLRFVMQKKTEEIEKHKQLVEVNYIAENEWTDRVKGGSLKKFDNVIKYQNKLAELRRDIFSAENFDDDKIGNSREGFKQEVDREYSVQRSTEVVLQQCTEELRVPDVIDEMKFTKMLLATAREEFKTGVEKLERKIFQMKNSSG